ncbi:hypothetical protein SAMN05216489_01886 [Streptomyces sp. 3213]|uniref:hypothetical protein n=1 Tax=Streptomyces sp. 3213.3 TaxID=1855348 RepID=UPI00089B6228|nr:hypothetical protein [Streptomyces sp. 3213.3]SEC88843.1 hypothetical protein SAMN05216489_01886 [Streptomyces sp. 3213] [Streptomyces sp. 3213.3]
MAAPPVIARTVTYHHTRVGRTELDKLLLVAGENAGVGTVTVKCTVGNAQLQEDTLDDLIAARAALPYVSNRTPWTELTLERDEGAVRYISVEFGDGLVTVTVRSGDPIWTHGQTHRLGEILEEAHGAAKRHNHKPKLSLIVGAMIVNGTAMAALVTMDLPHDAMYRLVQAMGGLNFATGFALLGRTWLRFRSSRPVLNVTADVQWGSPWSRLSNGDRIGLVSVVIAGLTLVATAATLM